MCLKKLCALMFVFFLHFTLHRLIYLFASISRDKVSKHICIKASESVASDLICGFHQALRFRPSLSTGYPRFSLNLAKNVPIMEIPYS